MAAVDPADLLFLAETSTPPPLTPTRARAPRGERAVGHVPRGRWQSSTLVATRAPAGRGPSLVLDGALAGAAFDASVERILAPARRPGQTVVLDNLSVHKSARARQLLEAAGCQLRFLPTSSPELNPIEHAVAKLTQRRRRAEARRFDAVATAIGDASPAITAQDGRGSYRDAGYNL